jgi:hypothetical protein
LRDYAAKNGDCRIPQKHKLADGYRLGGWVLAQREQQTTLSADRKARLEALPGWAWKVRKGQ